MEVIPEVRSNIGDDFVVGTRISGDEFVPGGLTLDAPNPAGYAIGSKGPDAADRFLAKDGREWLHRYGRH